MRRQRKRSPVIRKRIDNDDSLISRIVAAGRDMISNANGTHVNATRPEMRETGQNGTAPGVHNPAVDNGTGIPP